MRNSSLICTGSTLLPQVEACFQFILLPNRFKTRAYFGGSNNGPKQSKRVTKRLSFITICCEKSPFYVLLNNFIVWISDKEAFRIIQSHHVIKHAVFKQRKGFLTACRNRAAYCIFLPFGTPDSGSKFRRNQVFIRYHAASAGMTKGNRLSKRKRNVLRRDDYFYFHHYSFQICITDQAWGQYMAKFLFLHFVRLFFFACSPRDLMHWSSLRSLLRTYEWSTCSKSSILFTDTKSATGKKNDANIRHLHIS